MEQNVTPNETKETNEKEKVVEVLKLGMDAHTDFNAVADVAITTTDELGRVINTIFGNAFADYYGCKLDVTFMPNYCAYVLVPRLYFKVLDKSQYNENTISHILTNRNIYIKKFINIFNKIFLNYLLFFINLI